MKKRFESWTCDNREPPLAFLLLSKGMQNSDCWMFKHCAWLQVLWFSLFLSALPFLQTAGALHYICSCSERQFLPRLCCSGLTGGWKGGEEQLSACNVPGSEGGREGEMVPSTMYMMFWETWPKAFCNYGIVVDFLKKQNKQTNKQTNKKIRFLFKPSICQHSEKNSSSKMTVTLDFVEKISPWWKHVSVKSNKFKFILIFWMTD